MSCDISNHPDYVWRSFIIYHHEYYNVNWSIDEAIQNYCDDNSIRYAKQIYIGGKDDDHTAYRIRFPDRDSWFYLAAIVNEACKEQQQKFSDMGYDETYRVKMSYVIGTELGKDLKNLSKEMDTMSELSHENIMLIMHGLFNSRNTTYVQEAKFYAYALNRILEQMYK